MSDKKKMTYKSAAALLKKEFGEIVVDGTQPILQGFSTTSQSIDYVMGKGFPQGRIVELFGNEGSGKSSILMLAASSVIKGGGAVLYVDAEQSVDVEYTQQLTGLDFNNDNIVLIQPDDGEQGLDAVRTAVETGAFSMVIVDSVAALVSKKELEGSLTDQFMGVKARMMGQALERIAAKIRNTNTCLVFINQVREKIGVMYGNPETTPGGRALKFWASVRVSVNRGKHIEDKDKTVIGHYMNINCIKNKVAPPYRKCSVGLMYGEGLVETESLIDILCKEGKIEVVKQGSYKIVGTEDIIRGKANVLKKLDGKNILFNDTNVVGET